MCDPEQDDPDVAITPKGRWVLGLYAAALARGLTRTEALDEVNRLISAA